MMKVFARYKRKPMSETTEALEFILHMELRKFHIALADLTQLPEISNDDNWNYGCLCFGRKDSNHRTKENHGIFLAISMGSSERYRQTEFIKALLGPHG